MARHYEEAGPKAHRGLLGPAWRMQLAQGFLGSQAPRHPGGNADRWLVDLCGYLGMARDGDAGLRRARSRYTTIFEACELQEQPEIVSQLRVMVMGDMTLAEIQKRLGVAIAVVEAWEQIFFDVRDLRSATTWLVTHVIEPERAAGNLELVSELKLALGGGLVAARAILDGNATLPMDEAERLFQQKLKLSMKFDQALEMPLKTNQDRMKYLKLYLQFELETKRLELASHKLQQQCATQRDRHELAKMRSELAAKRAAQHVVDPLKHGQDGKYPAGQDCQPLVQLAQLRWANAAPVPPTPPASDAGVMRQSADATLGQSPVGAEGQPETASFDELLLDPLGRGVECLPASCHSRELIGAR